MENLFQVGGDTVFRFPQLQDSLSGSCTAAAKGGLVAAGELKSCVPAHIDNVGWGF